MPQCPPWSPASRSEPDHAPTPPFLPARGTAQRVGVHGGAGMPHTASKAEQIKVAERVLASQGWKAWPACSKKLGFR